MKEFGNVLKDVLEAMEEAKVPAELREIAFVKGLEVATSRPPIRATPRAGEEMSPVTAPAGDPLAQIAARMKIDIDAAQEVFHDDDGKLGIGVAPSRLAKGHATGTKQLALLVAAGRQAGGYDEGYTRTAEIREICRDFGRLDSSNFSATVQEMAEEFTFKGKGLERQVHVTKPGWDKARELVLRLTSGGNG